MSGNISLTTGKYLTIIIVLCHIYFYFCFISLHKAPLPPPNDVQISYIGYRKLIFSWNSVLPTCQALYYKINATNCGECPNTTDSTSVTCKLPPKSNLQQTCMFKVKTMVCGNISGVSSDPIFVTIKGYFLL